MKTRNLFLSLFAFAAVCACNKEADPVGPEQLDGETYIAVTIKQPSDASTRAPQDAGFKYGSDAENAVTTARFILYDSYGKYIIHQDVTISTWTDAATDPAGNVETTSNAVLVLDEGLSAPRYMIAVLNYPQNAGGVPIDYTVDMTAFYNVNGDFLTGCTVSGKFIMTNSVSSACKATVIPADKIFTEKSQATQAGNAVDVYVERVVARVDVKENATVAQHGENISYDGTLIDVEPKILGYTLANTTQKSNLIKNIEGITMGWSWDEPANFRSYWANSVAGINVNPSYEAITNANAASVYCQENTNGTDTPSTMLLVKARIVKSGESEGLDMIKYLGNYYSEDGFKTYVVNNILNTCKHDGDVAYAKTDLVIKKAESPAKPWEVVVKLTDVAASYGGVTGDPTTLLEGMSSIWRWTGGAAYFFTPVKHYGEDGSGNKLNGIVRNHVYDMTVNSVTGLGTPVVDVELPIDPEKPVDAKYSIGAEVNILSWKVVSQTVDLN